MGEREEMVSEISLGQMIQGLAGHDMHTFEFDSKSDGKLLSLRAGEWNDPTCF